VALISDRRQMIVGISGAFGVIYGIRTIEVLHRLGYDGISNET
jgi:4-hydroxy-3-polyprenylbenzoate decarboxylase